MITNLNYDAASLQSALLKILCLNNIEEIKKVATNALYEVEEYYKDNEIAGAVAGYINH